MAELGFVAGEYQIAMTGEFGRACEAITVHLRDGRFANRPQALPAVDNLVQVDPIAADGEPGARLLRALQIVTGAECASGPTNDEHAGVAVGFELVQDLIE